MLAEYFRANIVLVQDLFQKMATLNVLPICCLTIISAELASKKNYTFYIKEKVPL